MATLRQIEANRLNAHKSTGPQTQDGKAVSRFNALRHGAYSSFDILPGEDPAEFDALAAEYRSIYHPATAVESFLVETLVRADWERRRYVRAEGQLLNACMTNPEVPPEFPLGYVFSKDADGTNVLQKTFRRLQAAERSYFRAYSSLERLHRERPPQPTQIRPRTTVQPKPTPQAIESPQKRVIGFVPSFSTSPAARAPRANAGQALASPLGVQALACAGLLQSRQYADFCDSEAVSLMDSESGTYRRRHLLTQQFPP